jgi:hypothetical protein
VRVVIADRSLPHSELPEWSVVSHDVRDPARASNVLVRKGSLLERSELIELMQRVDTELHLAIAEAGDIPEDEAALHLGQLVAGGGVRVGRAHFGQVTLSSDIRGLLRIDAARLEMINAHPGVLVLTSLPDVPTEAHTPLGVVKCAPLFLGAAIVTAVEDVRTNLGPVIEVQEFQRHSVAFVAPTGRVRGKAFQQATTSLSSALEWYGSSLETTIPTDAARSSIAGGFGAALTAGADLILAAGAAATDPADLVFDGLRLAGGEVTQIGIPAEPGTACWIGRLEGRPVLGLASCELFGRPGALDLLLPRIRAGEPLDQALLSRIACGGLLVGGPSRIAPYHTAGE